MSAPAKFLFDMDFAAPANTERQASRAEIAQLVADAEARAKAEGVNRIVGVEVGVTPIDPLRVCRDRHGAGPVAARRRARTARRYRHIAGSQRQQQRARAQQVSQMAHGPSPLAATGE